MIPDGRRSPLGIASVGLLAFSSSTSAGVTPDASSVAMPCRPTIACTADFVPPGVLEIESGYMYRRLGDGADQSSAPILLKLTLTDLAQLQVGSNGPTVTSAPSAAAYLDDTTVGLKLHLRDQTHFAPAIAVSTTLSIPTFHAAGFTPTYDALFTLYVTKDVGRLHVDWNVGGNEWRVEGAPLAQAWTALALSVPLPRGIGTALEGYYFSDARPVSLRDGGILAALTYQPRKWIVLDAGPDVGLIRTTRVASAFFGVTVLVLDMWDTDSERQKRRTR